jgi:hypothetical protein
MRRLNYKLVESSVSLSDFFYDTKTCILKPRYGRLSWRVYWTQVLVLPCLLTIIIKLKVICKYYY